MIQLIREEKSVATRKQLCTAGGRLRVEKGSRDCLEHLWTIQSSPRPRSNSYFPGCTVQSAPNTDQIQLRSPLNEVSYDPFGTFGRQTAHLRPPSGCNTLPTRPPNCYWAIIISVGHNRMLLWDTAGSSKMPLCGKHRIKSKTPLLKHASHDSIESIPLKSKF